MKLSVATHPTEMPVSLNEAKSHLRVDGADDDDYITALIMAAASRLQAITGRTLILTQYELKIDTGFPNCILLPKPPLQAVESITYVDTNGDTQTLATSEYSVDSDHLPAVVVPAYNVTWPTTRSHINAVTVTYWAGYAVSFTADDGTDVITATNHQFSNGDKVRLSVSDDEDRALPTPLSENTDYYVISVSGDTFQLSATSGGGAIDITDTGTGTFYVGTSLLPVDLKHALLFMVGHLYEHREDSSLMSVNKVPFASEALIAPYRMLEHI